MLVIVFLGIENKEITSLISQLKILGLSMNEQIDSECEVLDNHNNEL
jgi:hypothetical protein